MVDYVRYSDLCMASSGAINRVFMTTAAVIVILGCGAAGPHYSDGTWRFVGDSSDEHGWTPVLLVEVSDGDVVRAQYDFLSTEGTFLSEDYESLRIRSHAENIDLEQALSLLADAFKDRPEADIEADGPSWLIEPFDRLTAAFHEAARDGNDRSGITVVDTPLEEPGLDPSLASDYLSF